MKALVVLACALACALAKPEYIVSPYGFSYTSASINPYVYSPYTYAAYAASPYVATAPASVAVSPVNVATSYHAQDIIGQASYGHVDAYQAHHAVQDAAGNKVGSYSYISPEGKVLKTDYIADATGYRVTSNALPVGSGAVPVPVVDTPEVAAAKAAHLLEVEKVKARVRRAVVPASTIKTGAAYTYPTVAYHPAYAHPYSAVYY